MIAWVTETLIATALLIGLVLLIRRPVARIFGPRAAYALWLAPLLKLLVPSPPEPVADTAVVIVYDPATIAAAAPASASPGLAQALFYLWMAGAALFLVFQLVTHHRFVSRALRQGRRLSGEPGPVLIESPGVEGPVAVGILRKRIILPVDFAARVTPEQRELALAHEHLHHRRFDLLALAGATVVLALHWFNPLAHAAYRAFRIDQEAACDAQLAERLNGDQRAAYAETLVRCAAAPVPRAICTLTTIADLKGRLTMLKLTHGRAVRLAGVAVAALLAAGGIAITAQAQPTPQSHTVIAVPMGPRLPTSPIALTLVPAPVPAAKAPHPPIAPKAPTAPAAGIAAAALAAPPPPPAVPQVRSFVITNGEARAADGKGRVIQTQRFVVTNGKVAEASGAPRTAVVHSCSARSFEASGSSNAKNAQQTSHFFICADDGKSNAEFADMLEKSLKGIEANQDMDPQNKSSIVARLRAKIAELRAN
ncbi:hypothetical protein G7078_05860 [Sphingomonas sinipercae]|uniref:Peptidase M56 domain-containing protein n=1 Tax=Sphingomonas sinipercae TaxID=2714944 RepID=A0A6G7ZN48_9SPHN|nr:M56 family metallopeptidase [Sphingomonas sinipercae]QIL02363.1 hypothetical protein G7078_05860 [Sphingomonas sinipercae]